MEQELISKIEKRIEELKEEYDFIGVRRSDEANENIDSRSVNWIDDERFDDEELRGLCTVAIDWDTHGGWKKIIDDYSWAKYVYIVAGNNYSEWGNDIGELIIEPEIVERMN